MKLPVSIVCAPWLRAFAGLSALGLALASVISLNEDGWRWYTIGLLVLTPIAFAGFIDTLSTRLELRDNEIVIRSNSRVRSFPRSQIVDAYWAKGVPIVLETRDHGRIPLPDVLPGGLAVANTLRAWIKADRQRAKAPATTGDRRGMRAE